MGLGRERSCSGGVHGARGRGFALVGYMGLGGSGGVHGVRGRGLALVGYMGLGGEVLLWWGTWG